MKPFRSILSLVRTPSHRARLIARLTLGAIGWAAVALAYPFMSDLPRYALY